MTVTMDKKHGRKSSWDSKVSHLLHSINYLPFIFNYSQIFLILSVTHTHNFKLRIIKAALIRADFFLAFQNTP